MPFKDTGAGQTHYLDEDGKLVGEISPEELAKWKALPMYAPLTDKLMTIEEIKAELEKKIAELYEEKNNCEHDFKSNYLLGRINSFEISLRLLNDWNGK